MKQYLLYLLLIVIGGILGGTSVVVSRVHEQPIEIWKTVKTISTDDGIIVPKGVDLRVHEYLSDDSVSLQLYLKVDGKPIDYFDKETDSRSNLIIPHKVLP